MFVNLVCLAKKCFEVGAGLWDGLFDDVGHVDEVELASAVVW